MSKTYFIRGTISVTVRSGVQEISVVPLPGFLAPEKLKSAIAFQKVDTDPKADTNQKADTENNDAKLIPMTDGKATDRLSIVGILDCLPALVQIAATQKPAELRVENNKKKWTVTGFTFPI